MNVLEFGCGTGSTALLHAPHVKHYLATDLSPAMIDIAREKLRDSGITNVQFETASLDAPGHRDKRFGAVLGLNILHLLDDPKAAIAQAFELLEPGGAFVTSTACLQDTRRYLKPVLFLARILGFAPPVTFLSRQQIDTDMESAGFRIAHRWTPEAAPDTYFVVAVKPE
jgi:ubiquinone/menaquinone biosynthesis C-methylase UbiE